MLVNDSWLTFASEYFGPIRSSADTIHRLQKYLETFE